MLYPPLARPRTTQNSSFAPGRTLAQQEAPMAEPLAPIVSDIDLGDAGVPGTSPNLKAVLAVPGGP